MKSVKLNSIERENDLAREWDKFLDVRTTSRHTVNIWSTIIKLHTKRRTVSSGNSVGEWKMHVVGFALRALPPTHPQSGTLNLFIYM